MAIISWIGRNVTLPFVFDSKYAWGSLGPLKDEKENNNNNIIILRWLDSTPIQYRSLK